MGAANDDRSLHRESLGGVIRTLREASGFTRRDLETVTARIGRKVSAEMIAKVEQGKKSPSPATMTALAQALGTDPQDLSERANRWQLGLEGSASKAFLRAVAMGSVWGATSPFAGAIGARLAGGALGSVAGPAGVLAGATLGGATLAFADRQLAARARQRLARLSDAEAVLLADEVDRFRNHIADIPDTVREAPASVEAEDRTS